MPVLSLHNTYSLPSGSASYTLGLSGAPNVASYSYPTVGASALDRPLLASGASAGVPNFIGGSSGLSGLPSSNVHPFGKYFFFLLFSYLKIHAQRSTFKNLSQITFSYTLKL